MWLHHSPAQLKAAPTGGIRGDLVWLELVDGKRAVRAAVPGRLLSFLLKDFLLAVPLSTAVPFYCSSMVSTFRFSPSFVPVIFAMTCALAGLVGSLERSARLLRASAALALPASSSLNAWVETKSANAVVALVASQVAALFFCS